MSDERGMTCIVCPSGCSLRTRAGEEGLEIVGAACERGREYARTEWDAPLRRFTGTVRVRGGAYPVVPVKSDRPVLRTLLMKLAHEAAGIEVATPVFAGAVLAEVLGGDVHLVATADVGPSVR